MNILNRLVKKIKTDKKIKDVNSSDAKKIFNIIEEINQVSFINAKIIKGDLEERYNYYIKLDEKLEKVLLSNDKVIKRIDDNREWIQMQINMIKDSTGNKILDDKVKQTKNKINEIINDIEIRKELITESLQIRNNTIVGFTGEVELNKTLYFCDDILTSHQGCRFKVLDESNETDNLIVSPFGIFNLEVKNIGSKGRVILNIEKDGRWSKYSVNERTGIKTKMEQSNVTAQVTRQCVLKQRLINEELKKLGYSDEYILVKPIIVIANDNVDIINNTTDPIIRIPQVYNCITNNTRILDDETISKINQIIKDNSLPPIKYEYQDIDALIFDILDKTKYITDLLQNLINYL